MITLLPQVRKNAMNNPEVQQIMGDPAMRMILEQMQTDPQVGVVLGILEWWLRWWSFYMWWFKCRGCAQYYCHLKLPINQPSKQTEQRF